METTTAPSSRCLQIRQAMQAHVESRLQQALKKLADKPEDTATRKKRQAELEKFQLDVILEKGAAAAARIAVASHIAKGIHPDLKVKTVTNLAVDFSSLNSLPVLGSHILDTEASLLDTTGDGAYNSAAYELYLLLDSRFEEKTLSQLLEEGDEDAIAAFEMGPRDKGFALQCLALLQNKCNGVASHTLGKQIYWLHDGADPAVNANFEMLVPLFPASLAHQIYLQIHAHRFGQANKFARQARRARKAHDGECCEYPGLAVQKQGGTKPQNISQLNSARGGLNYLLSSQPPVWRAGVARGPMNTTSVFDRVFLARPMVRQTVRTLRRFLESNPVANLATREYRESLVENLVDELVTLAGEYHQTLPGGWSREASYARLNRSEQLWLDPLRAELPEEASFAEEWLRMDWPTEIGQSFGRWLNLQLQAHLPVGDVEASAWAKALLGDEDGFRQHLQTWRATLKTQEISA